MANGFMQCFDALLEATAWWQQEVEAYQSSFWREFGKPEPETDLFNDRLSMLPFCWLQEADPANSEGGRILDRVWREKHHRLLEPQLVIGWRFARLRLMRITANADAAGMLRCHLPGTGDILIRPAAWETANRARGWWLAGWIVGWRGGFRLAPGYSMLPAEAGDILLCHPGKPVGEDQVDSRVARTAFRLSAALPRYHSIDYRTILERIEAGNARAETAIAPKVQEETTRAQTR